MGAAGSDGQNEAPRRRVFLSYSREDRERALAVIAALEQGGIEVWWDGLLTGGDAFLKTTETMLETSDAVVVLWTRTSVASHWVRDEATHGRERHRLVPVALDGSTPPLGFRQIHYINFKNWTGVAKSSETEELLRAIHQVAVSDARQIEFAQEPAVGAAAKPAALLKRRAVLIGGGAAVVLAGGVAALKSGWLSGGAATNSIAVMPFRNLSADPAKAYFSDGLAEELRAMLSLNRQIEVAAGASSNAMRDAKLDLQAVARKLDVAFVLEGSVQAAGEQLRLVARLVDGATGFETWSQVFDRKFADVLGVQREIATIVTDSLVSTMLGGKTQSTRIGGTSNAQAFDAYLRGAAFVALAEDEKSDRAALAAFDEAIKLDPGYAVAHAARSRALTVIGSSYSSSATELDQWNAKALAAARKAVELAPDLAEGQSALGLILMYSRLDLQAAREPMELSRQRGFGNSAILIAFASYEAYVGDFAAAREAIARAKRLDPLNPSVWRTSGVIEFSARNFPAAEAELRSGLALNAKMGTAHRIIGDIALVRGDAAVAQAAYEAEPSTLSRLRGLAIAANRRGDKAGAQRQFDQLVTEFGDNSLYQQAQVLAQWGDRSGALDALERGYAIRDAGLLLMGGDPLLDPIRQDPRFTAVLRKLGVNGALAEPN